MSENMRTVLNSKRAPMGGWLVILVGIAAIVGGAYGALSGDATTGDPGLLLGMATLFGAALVRAGQLLVTPKGGLDHDDDGHRLLFRGFGNADVLIVPDADVRRIRLVPRDEEWGKTKLRNWSCELERRSGCAVAVAESTDYDTIWALGRALEELLGVPLRTLDSWTSLEAPPTDAHGATARAVLRGELRVRVGRWGRLAETLSVLGAMGAVIGGLLMANVARAPVFGFLFGPTLFFMGVAFIAVTVVGRFGTDEISWDAGEIRHRSRLGRLAWGKNEIERGLRPYLRIVPKGLAGVSIELVGELRTVVLLGGVAGSSKLGYTGLIGLADELTTTVALPPDAPLLPD